MSVSEVHSTYQGLDLDGLERLVSVETVSILSTGGERSHRLCGSHNKVAD
jgi:hypothetical protein